MTVRRRASLALLAPAAVCVLASCGLPSTGVVQAGEPGDPGLAAAQIACTADAARRVADPGAVPEPVTVVFPGGRRVEGAPTRCPGL